MFNINLFYTLVYTHESGYSINELTFRNNTNFSYTKMKILRQVINSKICCEFLMYKLYRFITYEWRRLYNIYAVMQEQYCGKHAICHWKRFYGPYDVCNQIWIKAIKCQKGNTQMEKF